MQEGDDRYGDQVCRDVNKDEVAGRIVKPIGQVIIYEEAEVTIFCRKIYWQDLARENLPGITKKQTPDC